MDNAEGKGPVQIVTGYVGLATPLSLEGCVKGKGAGCGAVAPITMD